MKVFEKLCKVLLVSMLFITTFFTGSTYIVANDVKTNLALNKPVTASAQYSSMPASNLVDDDEESRWSSEKDATQWAYVDLGTSETMNKFQMIWESDTVFAENYNIYVSDDVNNWGNAVVARTGNTGKKSEDLLSVPVIGRYVKLEVTKVKGYPNVSCRDFKVLNTDEVYQDPAENVALNKTAIASSEEASSVKASNAFDGDTTSRTSRWGSNIGSGPEWIYVDLKDSLKINTVKVFWENRKATSYKIQIADNLSNPMEEADWTTVASFNDRPSTINDKIVLDQVYTARYVRLLIDSFTSLDPDGGVTWATVSIYEMEIYGGNPDTRVTIDDVLNDISLEIPNKGDTKLKVNLPEVEGFSAKYNGTDFEQVIGDDLTIYEPICDKEVKVSFKVTDEESGNYKFKEISVVVPGTYTKEENDNVAPKILPELQEWKGRSGRFTASGTSKIVYNDDALKETAQAFADDYEILFAQKLAVVKGTSNDVFDKDFYLTLTKDTSKGLQDEGYIMNVDSKVSVEAETTTGAYWATRTILQSLKQTKDIPYGIARDYPLYEVRGFILDVGRKAFTLDYLKQVVQQMSWYKMNDFQIHLNDNLIGLENVANPMEAYSAFRLESDVKVGGNNGLNQADLTSKDLFYTKDEFKDFIKESRTYGMNIVPEIDTPAHSLALTKVRPDLRLGTSGRQNDHLNLTTKYDESVNFVKGIFNEYMTGNDPVFDSDTIVHVGADEYNSNAEAYRKFSDDMLGFVQDTGRTARIWGSLSQCRGTTPVRSKDVQINLWNFGYANMDEMYKLGYDLINCNDGNYYVVPNAGYYYDYLSDSTLYNLAINSIGGVTIPAGDEQMIGGSFAVWNDMTDYLENGISEYDVYKRIENAIPLFGAKLWGKGSMNLGEANTIRSTVGNAPQTNFNYEVASMSDSIVNYPMDTMDDMSGNNYDLKDGINASLSEVDGKNALRLNGNESFVNSGLDTVGLGNNLRVKVKRTSSLKDEQILFESDYGTIKAVQKDTGNVGFSRENRDYSFDYELPINEWVELEFKNDFEVAQLYVNGRLVDTLGDDERVEGRPLKATSMIPFAHIGSKTNAFIGYVDDVRLGKDDTFNTTMTLDYAVWNANVLLAQNENSELANLVKQAKDVISAYAPEKAKIDDLTSKINKIISEIDYAKADYENINKYLDLILDDMSLFTDESVARLQYVVDNIRFNLPKAMQNVVDGYEVQLEKALAALEVKSGDNVNYVDNSKLTATASSYQDIGSSPEKVLDDDPFTMWHTKWSITNMPHWIDLKIDESTLVNGLVYTPRQTGVNGNVTEYEIQVSNGGEYATIASGILKSDSTTKRIDFDAVEATNVRVVYINAVNNNGSAAEIKLCAANVKADIEGLKALIDDASKIEKGNYTDESWNALNEKIAEAKDLVKAENPDANDIEIMKKELVSKMVSLKLNEKIIVDKSALQDKVNEIETLDPTLYTVNSWDLLNDALKDAKAILVNDKVTQEEVDQALIKLNNCLEELEEVTNTEPIDPDTGDKEDKDNNEGKDDINESKLGTNTGDKTNLSLWMSLLILSSGSVFYAKRKIKE